MNKLGATLAAIGAFSMLLGLIDLGYLLWLGHSTGDWLSDKFLHWQVISWPLALGGYIVAMIGCLIAKASAKH